MQLDPRTAVATVSVLGLIFALIAMTVHWSRRTYPGYRRWMYAGPLTVSSLFLLNLRPSAPDWVSIVAANSVLAFATILYLEGARDFRALPLRRWPAYVGGVVTIGTLTFFLYAVPNLNARAAVMSSFLGVILLSGSVTMLSAIPLSHRLGPRLTGALFGLCGATHLLRATYCTFGPPIDALFAFSGVNGALFLALSVQVALFPIGFILLADERAMADLKDAKERASSLQESLQESEERLRLALNSGTIGVWDSDLRNGRYYASPEIRSIYGVDDLTWGSYEDFIARVHPDDVPAVKSARETAIRNREPFETEFRIVLPSGEIRWLSGKGRAFYDDNGRVVRLIGSVTVITDRKRAEEALREADRRKNEFLATLAHELRNPMGALNLALHLARQASESEPRLKQRLDVMDRQISHLVRLVDDLLDIGRISAGKIQLHLEPVILPEVLTHSVEEVRPAIESRRHQLEIQIRPGQHRVNGDPARLKQVIANLLENAAKYTESNGRIRVSLAQEDSTEVVRVEDTGIGIPAEALPHVFDMFSQVRIHQGKRSGGLGIGLSIVRTLVELHGGTIDAASSGIGRGSTFTVRLPALKDERSTPAGEDLSQSLKATAPRRRVLIVDDNEDLANSLAEMLNMNGHQTWVAYDGFRAIEIARATELDIVLMDLGMPGLNGIETAKGIRALAGRERLPIAAITGWGQESDRARTREAGFDWHLVKPIEPELLSKIVATLEPLHAR